MAWFFVLALLLAWPTFGVSLLAWLAFVWLRAQKKVVRADARREKALLIDSIFSGRQAEFFSALNVPLKASACVQTKDDARKCGQHIVNYIAHNPDEMEVFLSGLKRWAGENEELCHPVAALHIERRLGRGGELHEVSHRAVKAIATQNPHLQCFQAVDLERLEAKLAKARKS